jgi:hypothetical protein
MNSIENSETGGLPNLAAAQRGAISGSNKISLPPIKTHK